ncbi:MAG: FMN-binding protein [Candidatus Nomurabacteria bacterium]|nr:FMN-binding protein [Candidatus Nomurabacteria bacterium]
MKKIILSSLLIFSFGAYILHVRILSSNAPIALTQKNTKPKIDLSIPKYDQIVTNPIAQIIKPTPTPPPPVINTGKYKNGTYTGDSVDASYGNVQVKVVISGGKIADVQFLDHPRGGNSTRINNYAMPYLISEAIALQDSNVDTVSGASYTSEAYRQSLTSALAQA